MLKQLNNAISQSQVLVSRHARERAKERNILVSQVGESIPQGEILETYPDDQPFPSCLIYSQLSEGTAIHSVWSYDPINEVAILITVYYPSSQEWIDGRVRRR